MDVFNLVPKVAGDNSRRKGCTELIESFEKGLKGTKNGRFGWDKKKKNHLACSVVRFVEIHGSLCIGRTLNRDTCFRFSSEYKHRLKQ